MKDYSLDRDSRKNYIVDMFIAENKTITVVFADKTRFENIANTPENIAKIEAIQEGQAKKAVANFKMFKRKEILAEVGLVASMGAAYGLSCAAQMSGWFNDPVKAIVGATVISGATIIPAAVHLYKTSDKMCELKKIKYREEHRVTLNEFRDHPNALVGLRNKRHFAFCRSHGEDPYSILAVDNYTQRDLETIVKNVEREKDYSFVYQKRYTR